MPGADNPQGDELRLELEPASERSDAFTLTLEGLLAPTPTSEITHPAAGLFQVVVEFRKDLERDAVESDSDFHYYLGVAFWEMGLFEEAIGEFQNAYRGVENNLAYPNLVSLCSTAAYCFLEMELPDLAVKWLQKGIRAAGADVEAEIALRYDIGAAMESAGHKGAALESFMEVYGMNIDYRDVAERIQ
jgi:tetratricopeptide (TPR) repeat protein